MKTPPDIQSAVALRYGDVDGAPRVVAKGRGVTAEQIIQRSREAGVFVHESPALLGLLMQVDLDREIPSQLYRVIAELLVWIHHLEREGDSPASGNEA